MSRRLLVRCTCAISFASFFATMGAESLTAVMLHDMFGIAAGGSYPFFLIFGLVSLVMPGVTFVAFKRLNLAQLSALWIGLTGAGFVAAVRWGDLRRAVGADVYMCSMTTAVRTARAKHG